MEKLTAAELTDMGICPTCYDREHGNSLYGDCTDKILFENELFECLLVGNPRANGHTIISSKKHYKDMMEIPDDLCIEIYVFARKMMNILKDVYGAESVYLCTMCDGPMNHFHVQLIPRYSFEKRGSINFVKERKEYIEDKEKIEKIRKLIKE
jgi:diadenosine tetraphosphate (Ap4A) HIT family hydrolase